MRRILASAGCLLAAVPVTAFAAGTGPAPDVQLTGSSASTAASTGNPLTTASQAFHPLEQRVRADEAANQLARAREKLRDRVERRRERRARRRGSDTRGGRPVAVPPALQSIAACESGGNPRAIGGGGLYRGKYQFDRSTWAAVGGSGDPAAAPESEQDRRAAMLYARAGASPWPVCGS